MSQISERHSTELKHQGSNSLRTTQTLRFGISHTKALRNSAARQSFLLADIHSRINIMKQPSAHKVHYPLPLLDYKYNEAYAYT